MIKNFLKTLVNVILLLCVLGFFMAGTGFLTFSLLINRREIEVPNLIGVKITNALEIANRSDLNLRLVEKQYNSEISEDYVINQRPLPGIKVKSGRPISVTISAGSRQVIVPDLSRNSLRQAQIILHNRGLEIGRISKVFSNKEMKGLILNQDPLPDEEVKRYSQVNLLVSKGPRYPNLIMPDLVEMNISDVSRLLEEIGLNIEDVVTQKSDVKEGIVLTQSPLAGSPVNFGDKIRLVVSGEEGILGLKEGLTYKVLNYKIPGGLFRKKVKIILEDETGKREIYDRIMRPNADLTLTFGIKGEARVKILIDGRVKEEKIFKTEMQIEDVPEGETIIEETDNETIEEPIEPVEEEQIEEEEYPGDD